ncbi:MAG: hypothetical protein KAH32_05995 [Chlamydiia bacterium]|nr:hypothetical protein [Chlamydiia bacterium]
MPIKLQFKDDRLIVDVNFVQIEEFLNIKEYYAKDKTKLDKMFLYIFYMYSLEEDNTFRDLDSRVKSEQAVYRIWKKRLPKPPFSKKEETLFEEASSAYILFSATEEERMVYEIDSKIEQIRKTVKETSPRIIEQVNDKTGEIKFATNMEILNKAINSIPMMLETKEKLISAMKKQSFSLRNKGGRSRTSFREKGLL